MDRPAGYGELKLFSGSAHPDLAREIAAVLAHAIDDLPVEVTVLADRMQAAELIATVRAQGISIVCLADLPPSAPSKTRYLVKRLRGAMPDLRTRFSSASVRMPWAIARLTWSWPAR